MANQKRALYLVDIVKMAWFKNVNGYTIRQVATDTVYCYTSCKVLKETNWVYDGSLGTSVYG